MPISRDNRMSRISTCLDNAHNFLLSQENAVAIIENQIKSIGENRASVCDVAELGEIDRKLFWDRQFLNPYAFEELGGDRAYLINMA